MVLASRHNSTLEASVISRSSAEIVFVVEVSVATHGQGNRSAINRRKPTLANWTRRAGSARTQVANSFIVSLRFGDGLGRQNFVPFGFWAFVWMMPCANPVQKFNSAKLILLDGLTVQESARSLAVLALIEIGPLVGANPKASQGTHRRGRVH